MRESHGQHRISATDGGVAAGSIGQVNNYINIDGLAAVLEGFLQRYGDAGVGDENPASQIKQHLSQQSPNIWVHDALANEFGRLRERPEFALDNYHDDRDAQKLADQVIEATRVPAGVTAVLAFWGDPSTERWWTSELERLARVKRYGGSPWLINLPLVAASMAFYAAGVASVCAANYGRLRKLFSLHGEPINIAGSVPLVQMLAPNPSAIRLTAAQNYREVSPVVAEALRLGSDVVEDAWEVFEILRLASQLMGHHQFDGAFGKYTAADRRRDATTGIDPVASSQAEATKNPILESLAGVCPARGLHLVAADRVYRTGETFRWGSPVAERLADELRREGSQHDLVGGLAISSERIELALRAVSRAVGAAGAAHRANWSPGAMPDRIWLDS